MQIAAHGDKNKYTRGENTNSLVGKKTNANTNANMMDSIARKTVRSKFSCKLKSNATDAHEEKNTGDCKKYDDDDDDDNVMAMMMTMMMMWRSGDDGSGDALLWSWFGQYVTCATHWLRTLHWTLI